MARVALFLLVLPALLCSIAGQAARAATDADPAPVEARLAETTRFLAADPCEGRGLGSRGINLAADFIAARFRQYGLKTDLWEGGPFQKFQVATDAKPGPDNHLTLLGPPAPGAAVQSTPLVLGKDFTPLAISGDGSFDLPLVFAGYGITARNPHYDDFADLDVSGKAVIMLRHEPRDGADDPAAAPLASAAFTLFHHKASNAYERGAAAVIFCTDAAEIRRRRGHDDTLMSFHLAGSTRSHPDLPLLNCRRAVVDSVLRQACGKDLAMIEAEIDRTLVPHSRALTGWRLVGRTRIEHVHCEVKNVVAVWPGQGPAAAEAVVLGAHYDHLGYGSRSSLPSKPGPIYHGADDNASGVAVILEAARTLARRPNKPHRQVVFIAFTGEEWGFWGSSHYVNYPLVPIEQTTAMVNLDMVGRLRNDKLTVNSVGTGTGFSELLERINRPYGFKLTKVAGASGRSDQAAFYAKKIPNLHLFTGKHPDYHSPTDTFDKLNLPGMRRIAGYVTDLVEALAESPQPMQYVAVAMQGRSGDLPWPFFGCIPDFTREEPGYPISGVIPGSPADRCGLRAGDVVVRIGKSHIGIVDDFDDALQKYVGGERVRVTVRRKTASMTFEATLAPPQ
ncbi:MAG: M20/M25/M40 family metallo-hydrolase [Thermoguttaceae bacterium]